MLGRAGHDLVHDRFCVELMVAAVQDLYDEGAAAVRPREVTPGRGPLVRRRDLGSSPSPLAPVPSGWCHEHHPP